MLNKKGAFSIEYALIFAFILATGVILGDVNFREIVAKPYAQVSAMLEGKSAINSYDSFWKAINRDKTSIIYNGQEYKGILDYITHANSDFTSGSTGIDINVNVKPSVDGKEYVNASSPIHEILTANNYTGHEDITWSVIGDNLYVYDAKKLTLEDVGQNFKVERYNLRNPQAEPTQVTVRFVKSSKGAYGYLRP